MNQHPCPHALSQGPLHYTKKIHACLYALLDQGQKCFYQVIVGTPNFNFFPFVMGIFDWPITKTINPLWTVLKLKCRNFILGCVYRLQE
jgi:hypothetical protein